jgi:hypothetical protein
VHVEHAALKGFNGRDGARAHNSINDEGALRWLHVAVEEFLHQTDVVCAIEATMTNGGHNGLHLQFLSMLRCSIDVAISAAGHRQPSAAHRSLCSAQDIRRWQAAVLVATMPAQMYTVGMVNHEEE